MKQGEILIRRMTPQRRVILEELRKLKSHPTASELYKVVRERLPHISLGTVYRNLDILSRSGMALKLVVSDAQCRFDGDLSVHYHVRCVKCGRVDDVVDLPAEVSLGCPDDLSGYRILGHRLEFLGVCPGCLSEKGETYAEH